MSRFAHISHLVSLAGGDGTLHPRPHRHDLPGEPWQEHPAVQPEADGSPGVELQPGPAGHRPATGPPAALPGSCTISTRSSINVSHRVKVSLIPLFNKLTIIGVYVNLHLSGQDRSLQTCSALLNKQKTPCQSEQAVWLYKTPILCTPTGSKI